MGTLARWAAHVAGVGGVLVAVALAWLWGHESGYWEGLEAQPHGFLDEGLIDR
jgi:hypothetical protein